MLNDPGTGILWLIHRLAQYDQGIEAGQILLSGSFIRPIKALFGSVSLKLLGFQMSAPTNDFKHRLKAGGECLHGIWLGFADPYATEMAAIAGFDWLLIDSEHGPERYHAFKPLDEPFLSAERPITLRREGSGLCFQAAAYQK